MCNFSFLFLLRIFHEKCHTLLFFSQQTFLLAAYFRSEANGSHFGELLADEIEKPSKTGAKNSRFETIYTFSDSHTLHLSDREIY